ncbi:MAG: VCBS repeat-containing protein, partial [Chloroflexota bacterium]|nr:VCBS repeat-containing protein [Chloroflexota bacterium]
MPHNNVSLLFGNGHGTVQSAINVPVGTGPDGIANATRNTASVLINGGSGAFPTVVTVNVGLAPAAVAVGDFNGD